MQNQDIITKNLELWDNVSTSDPEYTREFSAGGGYSGTAINGAYMIMKATKQWGPIGINWGYEILEERIDNGAPGYDEAGEILGHTMTHTIHLALWVKMGDEMSRVEHFGHTPFVYWNRTYKNWVTDQEAPKKSLTDAIKKCLSMYGFCADIYLGMFDDVGYVEDLKTTKEINKADDKLEAEIKAKQEYDDWFRKHLDIIKTAVNINELELVFKGTYRKAQRKGDRDGILQLTRAKDARLKQLQEKENNDSTSPTNHGNEGTGSTGPGRSGHGDSGSGHDGGDTSVVRREGERDSDSVQHDRIDGGTDKKGDRPATSKKKTARKSKSKAD